MTGNLLAGFKLQRQVFEYAAWQNFLLQRPDRGDYGSAAPGGESRKG